ncbi:MAG: MBL fold metallo-hydrolase [Bacilli bacterium]|nr:MBL fold metallo-hydrolase [Bacilli bacterium]
MAKLLYQGHASLRITTSEGKVIYIDPFAGEGYDLPADMVLITHEHYDHNAIDKVKLTPRTIIIRSKDALINGKYNYFRYFGAFIQAVPASNARHDVNECVGYLIELEGKKIYVAGDTDYVPYMDKLGEENIDYCFLPIDGIYNMGPKEATRCAGIIKPKKLIPYHMKPGMLFDIKMDMQVTYPGAILVRPGDEIDL